MWHNDNVIDVHGHIGTFKGYDLSVETLTENVRRSGVRLVLISNIDGAELPGTTENLDEVTANTATAETVRKFPGMMRGLVWARPKDGAPTNLEPFLKDSSFGDLNSRLFVGMKLHPMMNHFAADDPRVDGYLNLCEKFDVPAVFHCDKPGTNGGPEKIYAAARRHPKVPIVLYHMVFYGPHSPAIDAVKVSIAKNDADLYLETAQAKPEDVIRAVKEIGADRVLWGTDATYFGKDHYSKYEPMMNKLRSELSAEDFAKVVSKNAIRLFRLSF